MDKLPHIIEFCGIPYSRKTTTLGYLEAALRKNRKDCVMIEEFNGGERLYQSSKYSPDLNIVRALKCMDQVITNIHTVNSDFILVDRGVFDSFCWLNWFDKNKKSTKEQIDCIEKLLKTITNYSRKYSIIWMDSEAEVSNAIHGKQGSIINYKNLFELRAMYETVITKLYDEQFDIKIISVKDHKSSGDLAEYLVKKISIV